MKINRQELVQKLRETRETILFMAQKKVELLNTIEKARGTLQRLDPRDPCLTMLIKEKKHWITKLEELVAQCDENTRILQALMARHKKQLRVLEPLNHIVICDESNEFTVNF